MPRSAEPVPDVSRLPEIVDASAAVAAAYVPGVVAAYGVGSGLVTVPAGGINAGQLVPSVVGNVVEPGTHWSFVREGLPLSYSGTVTETAWTIEMRLYVNRADLATAVAMLANFAPRYQSAFALHVQLLGTITSGSALLAKTPIRVVYPPESPDAWISFGLNAIERLDFGNVA